MIIFLKFEKYNRNALTSNLEYIRYDNGVMCGMGKEEGLSLL